MDKIVKTAILFCVICTVLGCTGNSQSKYNIIFRPRWWIDIDLNNKTISVDLTKHKGKLDLSEKEEKMIWQSFDKHGLRDVKGDYSVGDDREIVTPVIDFIFIVMEKEKKVLDVSVNLQYKTRLNSKLLDDKLSGFRDDVLIILKNNPTYKNLEAELDDYIIKNKVDMM